jgi:hypothetical protein
MEPSVRIEPTIYASRELRSAGPPFVESVGARQTVHHGHMVTPWSTVRATAMVIWRSITVGILPSLLLAEAGTSSQVRRRRRPAGESVGILGASVSIIRACRDTRVALERNRMSSWVTAAIERCSRTWRRRRRTRSVQIRSVGAQKHPRPCTRGASILGRGSADHRRPPVMTASPRRSIRQRGRPGLAILRCQVHPRSISSTVGTGASGGRRVDRPKRGAGAGCRAPPMSGSRWRAATCSS